MKRKLAGIANGSGLEITELFGGNRGKRRTTSGAKYRNFKEAELAGQGVGPGCEAGEL